MAQRTVNRILQGRDTCSHLKVEHCYWEMVTMFRSRNVIHRGSASFWYMIHLPVLVIILVLKESITFWLALISFKNKWINYVNVAKSDKILSLSKLCIFLGKILYTNYEDNRHGPPTYGRTKAGQPARTYIQRLCEDTGCSLEDLPEAMNDREKWRERIRDIHATSTTWWWMMMIISVK